MRIASERERSRISLINDHGMVLSVLWHEYAICQARDAAKRPSREVPTISDDVEIACYHRRQGDLVEIGSDTVRGYVPVAELCAIIGAWPSVENEAQAAELCRDKEAP